MDWKRLDEEIDELRRLIARRDAHAIPAVSSEHISSPTEFLGFTRNDWRPVWAKAKEIQAGFNSKVRYPTNNERQQAWERFNALRDEASRLANAEREKMRRTSEYHRDEILSLAQTAGHNMGDVLHTQTVDEMRSRGATLKQAGLMLSTHKRAMLREHKDECFEAIRAAREFHDQFWQAHKAVIAERQREWKARQENVVEKIRHNIESNRERLSRHREAMRRSEARIDEINEKIASTTSDKWQGIFSEWLIEEEAKLSNMREHEQRLEGWVEEGLDRLRDM